jgi:hypothetical protein
MLPERNTGVISGNHTFIIPEMNTHIYTNIMLSQTSIWEHADVCHIREEWVDPGHHARREVPGDSPTCRVTPLGA